MEKEQNLEKVKQTYVLFEKKYGFPSFQQMNQDFNIERMAETETDLFVREIRRYIADKIGNSIRFVEALLNPQNVPMYVFSIVKCLTTEDRKKLSEAYKALSLIEIQVISADLDYSEEKEANIVKESFEKWQLIKKELLEIMEKVNLDLDKKQETSERGYFG